MIRLSFVLSLGSSTIDIGVVCTIFGRVIDDNTKKRSCRKLILDSKLKTSNKVRLKCVIVCFITSV